ncbi:class I SAM-dependent methyltransferase [Paenibacillus sp. HJGM_3]|uniref:class I SAM-dependent methyltransferase n=1 Tax=Paenibacillus sp. HJGM_3 TaxID=3379816 RepID=UPI00385984AC
MPDRTPKQKNLRVPNRTPDEEPNRTANVTQDQTSISTPNGMQDQTRNQTSNRTPEHKRNRTPEQEQYRIPEPEPNHTHIYNHEADRYHQLIAKQPSLLPVLEAIRPIRGLDVVDVGAGTGRLTLELAPHARSVVALDASAAMLGVTRRRLDTAGLASEHVRTAVADHRALPLADGSADLIVAGWTICYAVHAGETAADANLRAILAEMKRVLRPQGTIVILETMDTGVTAPNPPSSLTGYYEALERQYGFQHKWIRTDYTFDSPEEAARLTGFFFGAELAKQVRARGLATVPECAGVWWLQL